MPVVRDWTVFAQAAAVALQVEHLVWSVEQMRAGLSMGQLDMLKSVLLDQVTRVDEAKVRLEIQKHCSETCLVFSRVHILGRTYHAGLARGRCRLSAEAT